MRPGPRTVGGGKRDGRRGSWAGADVGRTCRERTSRELRREGPPSRRLFVALPGQEPEATSGANGGSGSLDSTEVWKEEAQLGSLTLRSSGVCLGRNINADDCMDLGTVDVGGGGCKISLSRGVVFLEISCPA